MFDPRVMRLGLGTAQFGLDYGISNRSGQVPTEEIARILTLCRQAGINKIDTAQAYGNSESALGQVSLEGFRIVTKARPGLRTDDEIIDHFRKSLQQLGLSSVDGLLVHQTRDLLGPNGQFYWRALERLKGEGLVEHIGFSCYVEDNPLLLAQQFKPDLIQLPVSILDQRLAQAGTLDELAGRGIKLIGRSVFLQGLILMEPQAIPPALWSARPYVEKIARLASSMGLSPLFLALNYALSLHSIDQVVVGVTQYRELETIIQCAQNNDTSLDLLRFACPDPLVLNPSRWHELDV